MCKGNKRYWTKFILPKLLHIGLSNSPIYKIIITKASVIYQLHQTHIAMHCQCPCRKVQLFQRNSQ